MAPKRNLRRPAVAPRPARRLRRPAAAVPPADPAGVVSRTKLRDLSLVNLQKLGFIKIDEADYYGRKVKVAGEVKSVAMEGLQLFLEMRAAGTTDEGLLRALGGGSDRALRVHVCDSTCEKRLTGDRLVHAEEAVQVSRTDEDWLTNIEEVVPGGGNDDELRVLRDAAGEPRGVEDPPKVKSKKKEKKEKKAKVLAAEKAAPLEVKEVAERGVMDLRRLFEGTGLDPDAKTRAKIRKKARRVGQSAKKKKKKKNSASSSTGSSSSSTSSSSASQAGAGLFDNEQRLLVLWKKYPGVLTAQAVSEAKDRLLTSAGTMWSEDRSKLAPVLTRYCRQVLITNMAPPMAQEALTVCAALDMLLQGKAAAAADILAQRAKSLEAHSRGAHWTVGRQLELIKLESSGIAESGESLNAARRAREEDKLKTMLSRPGTGRAGDSPFPSGGKARKGKDKGAGKGKAEETNRQKGGEGRKDEAWKKKG